MINWIDSKTIRFLALTWLGGMLLQLVPMLQMHKIDWWALGSQSIATLAGILIRMAQPDVVAPAALDTLSGGILNSSNAPRPGAPPMAPPPAKPDPRG